MDCSDSCGKKCFVKKVDGQYICQNDFCSHWSKKGCLLGKISLSCDNIECKWNTEVTPGIYRCSAMHVHLDANGKCLNIEETK